MNRRSFFLTPLVLPGAALAALTPLPVPVAPVKVTPIQASMTVAAAFRAVQSQLDALVEAQQAAAVAQLNAVRSSWMTPIEVRIAEKL